MKPPLPGREPLNLRRDHADNQGEMATQPLQTIDGPWSVGVGITGEGNPAVYRDNAGLDGLGPTGPYREVAVIAFPFAKTGDDGRATSETVEQPEEFSVRITAYLKVEEKGVPASTITTPTGGRSFCLYLSSLENFGWFGLLIPPYKAKASSAKTGHDPNWTVYRELLETARSGAADMSAIEELSSQGLDPSALQLQKPLSRVPRREGSKQRRCSDALTRPHDRRASADRQRLDR
jgi:hypothetical protein